MSNNFKFTKQILITLLISISCSSLGMRQQSPLSEVLSDLLSGSTFGEKRFNEINGLLDAGANVNAPLSGGLPPLSALIDLAYQNMSLNPAYDQRINQLINRFIAAGADVNATNVSGMTALHAAVSLPGFTTGGMLTTLEKIIELSNHNKLIAAQIVDLLIAAGANVQIRDKGGRTALDIANRQGYTTLVERLQKAPDIRQNPEFIGPSMSSAGPAMPQPTTPNFLDINTLDDFLQSIRTGKAPQSTAAINKFKTFLRDIAEYKLLRSFNEDDSLGRNYRRLTLLWHPDKQENKELADLVSTKLNAAKEKFENDDAWRTMPKK
jgi:ankyrin repeat protein